MTVVHRTPLTAISYFKKDRKAIRVWRSRPRVTMAKFIRTNPFRVRNTCSVRKPYGTWYVSRGDDDRTKSKADASITGSTICERIAEPNNILIPLATHPSGVCVFKIIRDITPVQNGFRNREHVRVKRVCFTDRKTFFSRDTLKTRVLTLFFFLTVSKRPPSTVYCPPVPVIFLYPYFIIYFIIFSIIDTSRFRYVVFNAIYRRSQTVKLKIRNLKIVI